MRQLASTYGETWHTWHSQRNGELPVGIPALMAGFTGDDQIDPALLQEREGTRPAQPRRSPESRRRDAFAGTAPPGHWLAESARLHR